MTLIIEALLSTAWKLTPNVITGIVVALFAVWYSHNLSEKRAYKQLFNNLLTEIKDNIEHSEQIEKFLALKNMRS